MFGGFEDGDGVILKMIEDLHHPNEGFFPRRVEGIGIRKMMKVIGMETEGRPVVHGPLGFEWLSNTLPVVFLLFIQSLAHVPEGWKVL